MGRLRRISVIIMGIFVLTNIFFIFPFEYNLVEAAVSHGLAPIGPGNNTSSEDLAGAPYDDGPSGNWEVIWSPLNNPHYIEDNYTIEVGWNLVILPGSEIRFQPGTRLIVHGGLTADGTGVGITFTSNQTVKNPGDWDGIYIDGGWLNSMINCNIEYAINGIYASNWGMLGMGIQNSVIHDVSDNGVYLDFVMGGPSISSTDIYNCTYGVYSLSSTLMMNANDIYNNDYGVHLGVNPAMGPIGQWLWQNNITYNLFDGVYIDGESPGIDDNYISHNGRNGIYMTNESWAGPIFSMFTGNTLESNSGSGIWLVGMNPELRQNTILNGTYGIYSDSAQINIYDSIIQGSSDSGIVSLGINISSVWIENSTLSSPFGSSFSIDEDSHITTLNTTFDKSRVNIQDAQSNLTVNWWVHVKVNESDGDPAIGASVWLNNSLGDNVRNDLTNSKGRIDWIQVTEYIDGFGAIDYDTHIGSALNNSEKGITYANIDSFKTIYIDLNRVRDFQIPLQKGWNMVSVPLNQTDTALDKVLASVDGNYKSVQRFDSTDSGDSWKHNLVGKSFGNDLLKIDHSMGLWVFMEVQDTLFVEGDLATSSDIQLYNGWNFIGYPSLKTKVLGDALSSIAGKYDAVWNYNVSDSLDPWKSELVGDLTQMEPGKGYWIHATQDCTWTLDSL